jgi:tRNA dimethylallyltransferase
MLLPPRADLYRRCDERFERMLEAGALEEVRSLLKLQLPGRLPVMKAIGVAELAQVISGKLSLEGARKLAQAATRRYAKRQTTWLRTQVGLEGPGRLLIDAQYSESHREKIFSKIREFLLTGETSSA